MCYNLSITDIILPIHYATWILSISNNCQINNMLIEDTKKIRCKTVQLSRYNCKILITVIPETGLLAKERFRDLKQSINGNPFILPADARTTLATFF